MSSMFLWSFLDEKFQGKTPKFIRISWLLLLDLLIAAFLSLALAQPVLNLPAVTGSPSEQIVLIDTSASMMAQDGEPDRITMAQNLVVSMIEAISGDAQLSVYTIGGEFEMVGSTSTMGGRELIKMVRELSPGGIGVDLRGGLAAAQQHADPELVSEVFVVTDGAFQLPDIKDFPLEIRWVFIGYDDSNQAVIDPQLGRLQGGQRELFFRVVNFSDAEVTREIQIRAGGDLIFTRSLTLAPRVILPQLVDLSGELTSIEISLAGSDLVPGDDTAFIGAVDSTGIDVALVAADPFPIDRAISSIPETRLTLFAPDEYAVDLDFDLVIFRGMIPERWPSGTVLVFDPPQENSVIPILPFEPVDTITMVQDSEILEGVDLTGIRWGNAVRIDSLENFEILASAGDLPLLATQSQGGSEIYLFTPLIAEGNFTKHPAFPILLSNLAASSQAVDIQPTFLIGEMFGPNLGKSQENLVLTSPGGEEISGIEGSEISLGVPGSYNLSWRNRFGEQIDVPFGVNQGHLDESNIAPQGWRTGFISEDTEEKTAIQIVEVPLAPWLLVLVTALLVVEAWRAWR